MAYDSYRGGRQIGFDRLIARNAVLDSYREVLCSFVGWWVWWVRVQEALVGAERREDGVGPTGVDGVSPTRVREIEGGIGPTEVIIWTALRLREGFGFGLTTFSRASLLVAVSLSGTGGPGSTGVFGFSQSGADIGAVQSCDTSLCLDREGCS